MRISDIEMLRCPGCRSSLEYRGSTDNDQLDQGTMICAGGCPNWPVRDGVPKLYREETIPQTDRFLKRLYDTFYPLHDPAVRYVLPLAQFGTEKTLRDGYLRRLKLEELEPRSAGEPIRILEVSIGCGANVPLLKDKLPVGLPIEIWGVDLSEGMLGKARRVCSRRGDRDVHFALADAHALPFDDNAFDRVFHVGGINGFGDPHRALAEMSRVALPETPIVVVDEQLDPARKHSLYAKAMFRLITFYDTSPHCPREALPGDAIDIVEEQVSRFFYCLSFRAAGDASNSTNPS